MSVALLKYRDNLWRLASATAMQALAQGLAFAGGIVVLRWLDPAQYALYTLATAALGAATLLSDGGIGTGTMALARLAHDDRTRLGQILRTALDLRRLFGAITVLLLAPVLWLLLQRHGASLVTQASITALVLLTAWALLSGGVLEIAPRITQDLQGLQRSQIGANALRLAALGLLLPVWPGAAPALAAALLAQAWLQHRMGCIARRHAELRQPASAADRLAILALVRRELPGAIYFGLSGQIVVALASLFSSTAGVAQVGALGRVSMLLNVLMAACSLVIVPRFARLPAGSPLLRRRFWEVILLFAAALALLLLVVWLFPAPLAWLLGPQYAGLLPELMLSLLASGLALLYGLAYSLSANRGHVMAPGWNVGLSFTFTLALLLVIDCSTVRGILLYSVAYGALQLLMWIAYAHLTTQRDVATMASPSSSAASQAPPDSR